MKGLLKKVLKKFFSKKRVLSKKQLDIGDEVVWNTQSVEASIWAKDIGPGPFFINAIEKEEDFILLTLSDKKGIYIKNESDSLDSAPLSFPISFLKKIG